MFVYVGAMIKNITSCNREYFKLQASTALDYLTSREDFWDQIDAGKHGGTKNGGCMFGGKVCESLRFQM